MVITQNKTKPFTYSKEKPFAISVLEGSIGKAVVETYFNHFGYEIYPFGYENHYANVTRFIKRDHLNDTLTKIRAMPDLLVFDRDNQESYLVEVKSSNNKNISEYWIEKYRLDSYINHWREAFLVVYMIPFSDIYCIKISEIKDRREGTLPGKSGSGYFLKLDTFFDLPHYFQRIDRYKYNELCKEIRLIFEAFRHSTD